MITFARRFLLRSCHYIDSYRNSIRNLSSRNQYYLFQRKTVPTNFMVVRFCRDIIEPVSTAKASIKNHKKTPEVPKITLLNTNNSVHSVTTFNEAEKIAAGCNLKLVRIVDSEIRTSRPVFRLMTDAQYLEEELRERGKRTETKKQSRQSLSKEKVMMVSSKITDNDFQMKLKKTVKWVNKRFNIRVVISGTPENLTPQEELYKQFEKAVRDIGRIVQKIVKNGDVKFTILPPKEMESKKEKPEIENKATSTVVSQEDDQNIVTSAK